MDDHMLDRLKTEIELCFDIAELELEEGQDIKCNRQYKAAATLIKAYNQLAKLYYGIKHNKLGNVASEYKKFKEFKYRR